MQGLTEKMWCFPVSSLDAVSLKTITLNIHSRMWKLDLTTWSCPYCSDGYLFLHVFVKLVLVVAQEVPQASRMDNTMTL